MNEGLFCFGSFVVGFKSLFACFFFEIGKISAFHSLSLLFRIHRCK